MIINKTKNTVIARDIAVADTFYKRAKGLLGRKNMHDAEALIIRSCNSVHTFFMRFPIDVLFVDNNNRVTKIISCLKPFRLSAISFLAAFAIELPANTIQCTHTQEGDIISIE